MSNATSRFCQYEVEISTSHGKMWLANGCALSHKKAQIFNNIAAAERAIKKVQEKFPKIKNKFHIISVNSHQKPAKRGNYVTIRVGDDV